MRTVAVTLAALALAAAGTATATSLRLSSGLHGVVMRGPTKPVCTEAESCEEPAAGLVLSFSRGGGVVARVKTDRAGAYTVRLRPGTYSVTTTQSRVGTGLTPRIVRVPRARLGRVDFHLDTGIQ